MNTCYGSTEGNWGSDIFLPILKQYPHVIAFTGHLDGLPDGKTLTVWIKAVDSYNNLSVQIVSKPFSTLFSGNEPH